MKLKDLSLTPPTKWFYVQFETAHRFLEPDYQALVESVWKHRVSNELPRSDRNEVADDIQDQICQRSDCNVCKGANFHPANLSAGSIFSAMSTLSKTWSGAELVPMEEAERRADICRRCLFNQPITGCFGVGCNQAMQTLFDGINKGRSTRHDDKLMGCSCCGCSCKVIVHFPLRVLRNSTPEERQKYFNRTKHCWRNDNQAQENSP